MTGSGEVGVIGLGVMGRALGLNLADHGCRVVGFDQNAERLATATGGDSPIAAAAEIEQLIAALEAPRVVLLLVPAGAPVDQVLDLLSPNLAVGDVVIDAGNSHYRDTQRRAQTLRAQGTTFLGVGVSGGEAGARHGPCIMAGGARSGWHQVEPLLGALAARVAGRSCAALLGPDGAGHFTKMVHNGIEYADMQLISEIHHLLRHAAGLDDRAIAALLSSWNEGDLQSYLLEISVDILRMLDSHTGQPMLDVIVDVAGHQGTGRWAAAEAIELGVPAPNLVAAVGARAVSAHQSARVVLAKRGQRPSPSPEPVPGRLHADLESALLVGRLASFAQGFELLRAGDARHAWGLPLSEVATIWQGGCIIRAKVLETIAAACAEGLDERGLLGYPAFAQQLADHLPALRRTVALAAAAGAPAPCLASSLAWVDGMHTVASSTTLLQAQRDYFGGHGIERVDREGRFHLDGSEA